MSLFEIYLLGIVICGFAVYCLVMFIVLRIGQEKPDTKTIGKTEGFFSKLLNRYKKKRKTKRNNQSSF